MAVEIICNGAARQMPDGATVANLITELGLEPDFVVVELNGAILARDAYEAPPLVAGAKLELIRFVGGG